jgi:hypothetical protein
MTLPFPVLVVGLVFFGVGFSSIPMALRRFSNSTWKHCQKSGQRFGCATPPPPYTHPRDDPSRRFLVSSREVIADTVGESFD